jgi:hypothetical protein
MYKRVREDNLLKVLKIEYAYYKSRVPSASLSATERAASLPDTWIFHDVGHVSIKYFKDLNGDFKRNGKEYIMGDFIHTTKYNELASSHGYPFELSESHGCIHVKPNDIDILIDSGFIKKGSVIEVKPYTNVIRPAISMELDYGRPDYEAHFYPGLKKLFIYQVTYIK